MSPEEAKAKIDELASLLSYEQNLQRRLKDRKDIAALKISKEQEKKWHDEIEEVKKHI